MRVKHIYERASVTYRARRERKMIFSSIKKSVLFMVLISLMGGVFADPYPVYTIQDAQVAHTKERFTKDFERRTQYARASYGILIGGSLWFAYKCGMLNFLFKAEPNPQAAVVLPEKIEVFDKDTVLPILAALIAKDAARTQELKILKDEHDARKSHWLIEGVKYVGVTGFSMIAGIVVQSKWKTFFDYALAEPTFDWFFSSHTIQVNNAVNPAATVPDYVIERHQKAIAPALELLYTNLLELISFSEYYTDRVDADMLTKFGMDSAPRYMLNTVNDFFADLDAAIRADDRAKAVSIIDAFRAELTNYIKDCQAFEAALFE